MEFYHAKDYKEVASTLKTDISNGLSNEEVKSRLKKYGLNELKKKKQKSLWHIFVEQFVNPIVWLLVVAGVAAFTFNQIPEGVAIIIVIVINAAIGFFMEWQAVRSMHQLLKMGSARSKVIRGGAKTEIDSTQIVPGDILYIEPGDLVTADARLVKQHNLAIKEAALTGESTQVDKHTDKVDEDTMLADWGNSVFKGTIVTRGNGTAIVVGTGNDTELGKISEMAQEAKKEAPPLDKRLNKLSKNLIWLTLGVTFLIFVSGIIKGREWLIMAETAIALAVAAIPEGLPVIATITLARGMVKLAKKKAVVKTLEAVQTLGETDTIFTDKTGTLTENEMYLEQAVLAQGDVQLSDKNESDESKSSKKSGVELLLKTGLLCNDSSFSKDGKSSGDPIEIALLRSAGKFLEKSEEIKKESTRVAEVPFDADIKMMGTVNKMDGGYFIAVKGAVEVVIENCSKIINENGEEVELKNSEKWLKMTDDLAAEGFRVLSFAYKKTESEPDHDDFIKDLVFIGLGCFIDPARTDVKEAVLSCKEAGIKTIMVTGDHPETAAYIAEKVGLIVKNGDAVKVLGKDLRKESDYNEKQKELILSADIFARTNPSQKLDIVELYQKNNHIVGMTGDGVNDAPALKKADIGIAMGQRGTEAAKEVADIVLKDDSFSSIVLAIRQGRIIFRNIRMFVVYLLSCNLSEILVVGTASFLGIPLPLLPLQILFLNMVTDVFPALALGMSEGEKNIMKKPPRKPTEPILTKQSWIAMFAYGMSMTISILGVEFIALYHLQLSEVLINNMTFYTLILVQLWNVFNLPGVEVSFFKNEVTKNKYVWMAILLSILIVVVAWLIPTVREALALTNLKLSYWAFVLSFSFIPTVLVQFFKRFIKVIE